VLTEKLKRAVAANVAKIESVNFDRPLAELLDQIDFEAIADHWLGSADIGGGNGRPFCKNR
jgi:hypothetical protein